MHSPEERDALARALKNLLVLEYESKKWPKARTDRLVVELHVRPAIDRGELAGNCKQGDRMHHDAMEPATYSEPIAKEAEAIESIEDLLYRYSFFNRNHAGTKTPSKRVLTATANTNDDSLPA